MLSDEQMTAISGIGIAGWEPVERPVGVQPLPDWVRGAHVDWMDGCGNAPTVSLKVLGDVYGWDDQRWVKEGTKTYITRHADGRARVLYHDGAVSEMGAWRTMRNGSQETFQWIVAECRRGEMPEQAAVREGQAHMESVARFSSPEELQARTLETKAVFATTAQGGFGGSNYPLLMEDGTTRILRGPWHGGAPEGFVEVTTFDAAAAPYAWQRKSEIRRQWHRRGGQAGLYLTEDLFLRIVARYCAHAPIARVQHRYGTRLEPYRAEWEMPKAQMYEVERMRAQKQEPAGPFWRVYWDGSERYCGSLRMPTNGFQEGVTP